MALKGKQGMAFAAVLFLGLSCTVKDPVTLSESAPMLSQSAAVQALFLGSDRAYDIGVTVDDANGYEDIAAVRWEIVPEGGGAALSSGVLLDNGSAPDIVAGDSRFTAALLLDDVNRQAGRYRLIFQAEDHSGLFSDTLGATLTVLDSTLDQPLFLKALFVPDTLHAGEQAGFAVIVSDIDGNNNMDSVWADLYAPYSVTATVHLRLDAFDVPDVYAVPWEAVSVGGMWTVRFQAVDRSGLFSPAEVHHFWVQTEVGPPEIVDVSAPDSISRSSAAPFLLTVTVSDPTGLADIESVYFNTTKPDGNPSGGNPFAMVDDGTQGDVTAGDGIYSLQIAITSASALGDYQFEFIARDRSGLLSTPVVHTIVVGE